MIWAVLQLKSDFFRQHLDGGAQNKKVGQGVQLFHCMFGSLQWWTMINSQCLQERRYIACIESGNGIDASFDNTTTGIYNSSVIKLKCILFRYPDSSANTLLLQTYVMSRTFWSTSPILTKVKKNLQNDDFYATSKESGK